MVLLVEPLLIVVVFPSKSSVTVVVVDPCLMAITCVLWVEPETVTVPADKVTWSVFPWT